VIALPGSHQLERRVLDTVSVDDLTLLLELFTTSAVEAFILRHVEVVRMVSLDTLE
jgi:hypothetical protein